MKLLHTNFGIDSSRFCFGIRTDTAVHPRITRPLSTWVMITTTMLLLLSVLSADANVIVRRAKLHNDSSCDVSQDGRLLCTFIQSGRGFNGDVTLGIFSLQPHNRAQCLYTKIFGNLFSIVTMTSLFCCRVCVLTDHWYFRLLCKLNVKFVNIFNFFAVIVELC